MSLTATFTLRRTEWLHPCRRRLASVSLAAALTLGVASACSSQDTSNGSENAVVGRDTNEFHGTLVDPPLTPAPITLRDTDGKPVRLDQHQIGTATAVFFGFTNCHDVCPTTMADLAAARRFLPAAAAEKVSLVFVTVDPKRDTPADLRTWLDQFDPDIVGLRGPVQRVHRAEDSLYASRSGKSSAPPEPTDDGEHAQEETPDEQHTHPPGSSGGDYGVDHTSIVYMFGPDGTTLIYTGGATPSDYVADLSRLLTRQTARAGSCSTSRRTDPVAALAAEGAEGAERVSAGPKRPGTTARTFHGDPAIHGLTIKILGAIIGECQ